MQATIYRRSLSYTSGAGQLIAMQARALRAAGIGTDIYCQRGAWRYWLRSGLYVHRISSTALPQLCAAPGRIVIDHGMELAAAQIVFCHNLMTEASRYLDRPDIESAAAGEREFFSALRDDAVVVANSNLVRDAIIRQFELAPERVRVCYPGFRSGVFDAARKTQLRADARRALGVGDTTALVGFVTSGDLHKRGIGIFLEAAQAMLAEMPRVRFLVVGSRMLPNWMRRHPLLANGTVLHRGRGRHPQKWMAALDLFLYPARFEEFGMVVLEAGALGIPVVTSRRVGAAECLPDAFAPWISETPDASAFADLGLRLLADEGERSRLSAAGMLMAGRFDDRRYAEESLTIFTSVAEAAA
jgi:glycosyltransferase involved in cell wall biosynthesis